MDDTELPSDASAAEPSSLSPRQLIVRRANAKKSTGPRTPAGKAAVRLNPLKHGFFARDVVSPVLDGRDHAAEFKAILDAFVDQYQPANALERMLVDEIAACCWRIRRLLRYECREAWRDEDDDRERAETEYPTDTLIRSFGLDKLANRQRIADLFQRGDVDSLVLPPDEDLNKIIRFEATVKRNLYRAIACLDQAQAVRKRTSGREVK